MLEKIGLPPKPSKRGNSWVVDASHCQGCSSQFTFINRKHHCRRCGGLFCGSCTQRRMLLRGQGDSPVRICDPCKTLEEAARFEMRGGNKNRSTKGGAKVASKKEDEILNQILGNDDKAQKLISSASCSNMTTTQNEERDISTNLSLDQSANILTGTGSATLEELREQAVHEKKKYKTLKTEGKPEEALRAFKRGKELERQAGALEISMRKNHRKAISSSNLDDTPLIKESTGKNNLSTQKSKAKNDISAELKELGWSDMDLHETEKKTAPLSLEGELFSLLKEVSQKPNKEKGVVTTDKSQVIAHKKKALELKRSGNLLEAKEELKRAKILERKIEEEELLGGDADDDSDDEFSSLIRSMDDDEHTSDINFSFDHFVGIAEDLAVDGNFDVTDEDMDDPEIASALESLGWTEDTAQSDDFHQPVVVSKNESVLTEVKSLKREALNQKRAGNTVEAMVLLKKAKLLEMEVESADNVSDLIALDPPTENVKNAPQTNYTSSKLAPKSKLVIQRELLALKKKALSLRREGRLDESQEELEKAKVLEKKLEEMNKAPTITQPICVNKATTVSDGDEEDVTDQDLQDPSYLSLLKNLGWDDEDNAADGSSTILKENDQTSTRTSGSTVTRVETGNKSRKGKSEIQRELLVLKRKALTLRRQGEVDEADETLKMASSLEAQLKEFEEPMLNKVSAENDKNAPKNTETSLLHEIAIGGHRSQDKVRIEKPEQIVQEKKKPDIHEFLLHEIAIGVHRSQDKVRIEKSEQIVQEEKKPDIHESLLHEIVSGDHRSHDKVRIHKPEQIVQEKTKQDIHESLLQETVIGDHRSQDKVRIEKPEQIVQEKTKPDIHESSLTIQQEILAYKRKAIALKREGKLVEAREELRQAKLLEKRLEEISQTSTNSSDASVSDHEKKKASPSSVSKPMSSRDRFKLQQESLGHKRKSLKLRREGKIAEADAEFELAKALEAQLEDLDSSKTSEPVDDVMVEDFLDPQLLSALQSIGLDDSRGQASVVERPVLTKLNTDSTENSNIEREQLAEKIKSEKVRALNLKRSGKQAEALVALRQAKMYEKKLQLLNSV